MMSLTTAEGAVTAQERLPVLLKERMAAAGQTQEEFAALLGIDQPYLSRMLAGKHRVGPKMARRLILRFPDLRGPVTDALLGAA
jgi:hypothetical protein